MYTPVNPSFTIYKWGVRGYKSHRHVFLMVKKLKIMLISIEQSMLLFFFRQPAQSHGGEIADRCADLRGLGGGGLRKLTAGCEQTGETTRPYCIL